MTCARLGYRIHALMSGGLPSRIHPFRLAGQGACLEGAVPLSHMHRLREMLTSHQGEARVSLCFDRNAGGLNVVAGRVRTVLDMQCQRCLQPVTKSIDRGFRLAVVSSDAEAMQLQAEYEVLQIGDESLCTRDLIEDELLLSLPLIPMHDDPAACDAAMLDKLNVGRAEIDNEARRSARSSFAVLKDLKHS